MKKKSIHNVESIMDNKRLDKLYQNVKQVIERAREVVYKTANFETVKGYWEIGRYIVEEEQQGRKRAMKGASLIKKLSEQLIYEYGSGFDSSNLKRMRKFYLIFPKSAALRRELSWTHYKQLITLASEKARLFYISESIQGSWGTRTLERAVSSKLYERTLLAQGK